MVDCYCGWKQERSLVSDESHIDELRQRVSELEADLEYKREVSECHAIDLRNRDAAIKSYVAQITTLKAALKVARDALNRAVDKFHDYAEIHAAKEATPENDLKVERNLMLSSDMDKALAKINEVMKP